ncbi:MAG: hypothetical protein FWD64_03465 [Acidobacteriaceae bacterium]|nr:hypothetical protein [Acidobacteriaceae bacterium]
MNTAAAPGAVSGKIASISGYILGVFSVIIIISVISESQPGDAAGGVIFGAIMLAFSVLLVVRGIQIKRRTERFRRYVSVISNLRMTSLDDIATSASLPPEFVKNDLQKMIDKGFFANASIDATTNEIIIGGWPTAPPPPVAAQGQGRFTCPGCGASGTKRSGMTTKCEYCGYTLS